MHQQHEMAHFSRARLNKVLICLFSFVLDSTHDAQKYVPTCLLTRFQQRIGDQKLFLWQLWLLWPCNKSRIYQFSSTEKNISQTTTHSEQRPPGAWADIFFLWCKSCLQKTGWCIMTIKGIQCLSGQ